MLCVILTTIFAIICVAVHNNVSLVIFSIVYGFLSGAITFLLPNIAVTLSPDMGVFGVRFGMLLIPISVGLLLGNPVAGAILAHGWTGLQLFTVAVLTTAPACIILVRLVMYGWDWMRKC